MVRNRVEGMCLALLFASACEHSSSFTADPQGASEPFDALKPVRVTFSADSDLTPAWSPDGAQLLYTFAIPRDPDHDRCIGALPGTGGSRVAERCPYTDLAGDSTTVSRWPAPGTGGLVAWTEYQTFQGRVSPDRGSIRIGTFDPLDPGESVQVLPYLAPSGLVHDIPTWLAWLSPDELVYVANAATYLRPCINCPFQEYLQGLEIVRLGLGQRPATVTIVPGTSGATSLSVPTGGGGLYFTLALDSRVWFVDLAGSAPTPVHDFAASGVPANVSVQGSVLTARINDSLHVVQLGSGQATAYGDTAFSLGNVTLSPDGQHVAAEMARKTQPGQIDLYLLEVP